ncbi:thioredoxin fold domain-containing protein [Pantoea agglomerans]|uniref:thioredoxin fold domain-containing protein n=1 Tax=Enterobacter agglomerans TaxID=549 RepID=UPI003D1D1BEA
MNLSRREGPFVAKIIGDLLSVQRYQTEEKWGPESGSLTGNGISMLFFCSLRQMPWFVVHSDGLYAQNAHDALTPLYRGEDAALLLRCINDLMTTVESKRLRSLRQRKYSYVAAALIAAGFLLAIPITGFKFLSAHDTPMLTTVDSRQEFLSKVGPARNTPAEPAAPSMMQLQDKGEHIDHGAPQQQTQQSAAAAPADGWDLPLNVRAELPSKLRNAASRGLFTVPLSAGHARTVYVFSDPNCPECQRMERHLEAASDVVNVVIFPVTIRGGVSSLQVLTPVMALPEVQRADAWKRLFSADAGVSVPGKAPAASVPAENVVELARGAIGVNEVAYHAYRLPGTPWTISDDGRYVPQSVLSSPAALTEFLNGGSHDGQ